MTETETETQILAEMLRQLRGIDSLLYRAQTAVPSQADDIMAARTRVIDLYNTVVRESERVDGDVVQG